MNRFVETLKTGRLSRAYFLFVDYKQALGDCFRFVKKHPIRASVYSCVIGSAAYMSHYKPNFTSYRNSLLEASNEQSLVSDLIRSGSTNREIKRLMKLYADEKLACWNFGVFSLIMTDPYPKGFDGFEKHCSSIYERWIVRETWSKRFVDVGFMGRWFELEKIMINYDVNEDEF